MTSATSSKAILPLHVDSTMRACYAGCPQKFFLEFCHGLRPARISIDLHAGACFASALEDIYTLVHREGMDTDKALLRAYGRFLTNWGDFEIMKDTSKTPDRVWEAIEDYIRTYSPKTDHVQPANLPGTPSYEFSFGIPLVPATDGKRTIDENGASRPFVPSDLITCFPLHPSGEPFIYTGRFDLLGVWAGRLVVRDEKTTTSIGASWSDQWDLRAQFMGYVWACQQSGLDLDTVIVRGVGILKTKIVQAEAIKQYSRSMIEKWHTQLRRDLWRIVHSWNEQYFDFNFADACSSYGGCSFRDVCQSDAPERWMANFVVRRWNPLDRNPVAEETAK